MNQKTMRLSRRYATGLRRYLQARGPGDLSRAPELGRQAVVVGLGTLELARIHEAAFATLKPAKGKNGVHPSAEVFFNAANAPIEETHRAARQGKVELHQLERALGRRTIELAASHRLVQRGVVQRAVMEKAFAKTGLNHDKSLEESLQLQRRLRQLTHRVMVTQEDERKHISRELQDEIAQTLLGINMRLLSLKQRSQRGTQGLKNEITSTQKLVAFSARSVRQFARELEAQPLEPGQPSAAPGARRSQRPAKRGLKKESLSVRLPKKSARATHVPPLVAPARGSFPVIAMAASVGGLKALSAILGGLPADFPAAIAIVMHVSPDHESILAEILNRRWPLAVREAHTGDRLAPAQVFIAPPNNHLFVGEDGRLKLSSSHAEKIHFARPSAEPLFASVARVYGKKAIAVVLTGGDGDGAFGVQIIKDKGGRVIAQDRSTSENFSMPETSIKTGAVDFILPLEEIAPMLITLV